MEPQEPEWVRNGAKVVAAVAVFVGLFKIAQQIDEGF